MKIVLTHEEFQAYNRIFAKVRGTNITEDVPYTTLANGIKSTHELNGDHIVEIDPSKQVKLIKLTDAIFSDKLSLIGKAIKMGAELCKGFMDCLTKFNRYSNIIMADMTEYWIYAETDGEYRPIYLISNTNGIHQKLLFIYNDQDHIIDDIDFDTENNAGKLYKIYTGHNYAFDAEASENITRLMSKYYLNPNESAYDIRIGIAHELKQGEERANAGGIMDDIDSLLDS